MQAIERLAAILSIACSVAGCATIASGTSQPMSVDTGDVTGADCIGVDKVGRDFHWKSTPASAQVRKGDGPMKITCSKDGHEPASITVDEVLTTSTFGNVLLGGLIGAGIDAASGAAQKYPDSVTVPMKRNRQSADAASPSTPSPMSESITKQLQRLNLQKEAGAISAEQYETQRRALLDKL